MTTMNWTSLLAIGAGAVLAAGLITLGRALPTIVASARDGLKDFGVGAGVQRREQMIGIVKDGGDDAVALRRLTLDGANDIDPGAIRQAKIHQRQTGCLLSYRP